MTSNSSEQFSHIAYLGRTRFRVFDVASVTSKSSPFSSSSSSSSESLLLSSLSSSSSSSSLSSLLAFRCLDFFTSFSGTSKRLLTRLATSAEELQSACSVARKRVGCALSMADCSTALALGVLECSTGGGLDSVRSMIDSLMVTGVAIWDRCCRWYVVPASRRDGTVRITARDLSLFGERLRTGSFEIRLPCCL